MWDDKSGRSGDSRKNGMSVVLSLYRLYQSPVGFFFTAQEDERWDDSLRQSKRVMKTLDNWSDDDLQDKPTAVANLYSLMGNAYLELGLYDKALQQHKQDKNIASEQ